jgi:predicted RNase H-like HicB family nuclease
MKINRELTAIIEKENKGYVALCPELDIASQGDTIEEAKTNLIEALELFFEEASEKEIRERLNEDVIITRVKIKV